MSAFYLYSLDGPYPTGTPTLVYEWHVPAGATTYGGGTNYTSEYSLELEVDIPPTASRYWSASFIQYGEGCLLWPDQSEGPRIHELDAYETFLDGTRGFGGNVADFLAVDPDNPKGIVEYLRGKGYKE